MELLLIQGEEEISWQVTGTVWETQDAKKVKNVNLVTLSQASMLISSVYEPIFQAYLWCWMWHQEEKKEAVMEIY